MFRLPRILDPVEIRVLGSLLEKEQTTPDGYPLTLKSLVAAANQRTNREPVMALSEDDVEAAIDRLLPDVLVWRVDGARVPRFKHALDRRWNLDPGPKAVITLLMLRGPQTFGELRSRSERLHPFPDLDAVGDALSPFLVGPSPLVVELPRAPGQKETRWTHLLGDQEREAATMTAAVASPAPRPPGLAERVTALEDRVAALEAELDRLGR